MGVVEHASAAGSLIGGASITYLCRQPLIEAIDDCTYGYPTGASAAGFVLLANTVAPVVRELPLIRAKGNMYRHAR